MPLIAMCASGILEGRKTLLNHVGKQKMGKADAVLTSSRLNLIICCLTSSIYLMKYVVTVHFTDINAHKQFLKILFLLLLLSHT